MKKFFNYLGIGLIAATSALALSSCKDDSNTTSGADTSNITTSTNTTNSTSTTTNGKLVDCTVDVSNINFAQDGKLTVGMSTDFAPMEFIDTTKSGQDQFVGADVTFAKALAQSFGLELEIKAMNFDLILPAVNSGIIDIAISGFSYTADRAASATPSACYWSEGDGGQVVIVKKSDISKYTTLESLNNSSTKIGAQTGSLQVTLVETYLPNATLNKITNIDDAITALKAGSLDGLACAKTVADQKLALDSSLAIVPEAFSAEEYEGNFAWVKKGNIDLKNAIDKVIEEITKKNLFAGWVSEARALQLNLGDKAEEIVPEE